MILERCRKHGITLNSEKFKFAEESVKFVGYHLSADGMSPGREKVEAIADFPEPQSRTELRSFLGLVNQLGQFSSDIAAAAGPLRELLKTKATWMWTSNHTVAFKEVKDILLSPAVLKTFDLHAETVLQTDASRKNGLGFALMQKQGEEWCLIQCGSRFLSDTET